MRGPRGRLLTSAVDRFLPAAPRGLDERVHLSAKLRSSGASHLVDADGQVLESFAARRVRQSLVHGPELLEAF